MRVTRVVAATSGSPCSLVALRYAEELAQAHDAVLVPVLAWQPPGSTRTGVLQPPGDLYREWRDIACQRMRESLLAVWGEEPAGLRVRPQVNEGPAGRVLVSVACLPGDVLVVGAGRRGPVHSMTGRWVSRYCAARASCPVILVPPPALIREAGLHRLAWLLTRRTVTAEQIPGDRGQPTVA